MDASAKPCSEKALRAAAISLARVSSIISARVLRTGVFFIRGVCVLTSMKCNLYFTYAAYVNSHALRTSPLPARRHVLSETSPGTYHDKELASFPRQSPCPLRRARLLRRHPFGRPPVRFWPGGQPSGRKPGA